MQLGITSEIITLNDIRKTKSFKKLEYNGEYFTNNSVKIKDPYMLEFYIKKPNNLNIKNKKDLIYMVTNFEATMCKFIINLLDLQSEDQIKEEEVKNAAKLFINVCYEKDIIKIRMKQQSLLAINNIHSKISELLIAANKIKDCEEFSDNK